MRRFTLLWVAVSGCAGLPVAGDGPNLAARLPVEVVGHVSRSCPVSEPQSRESVALRAAGEPDALETTQTDASGAFSFRVVPPGDLTAPLFIEARGVRALAKQRLNSKQSLVAELTLPCGGG